MVIGVCQVWPMLASYVTTLIMAIAFYVQASSFEAILTVPVARTPHASDPQHALSHQQTQNSPEKEYDAIDDRVSDY